MATRVDQKQPSRPASALPPTEKELGFLFTAFDRDQDGKISVDELVDLLRACGLNPTKTEAFNVMMEYDKKFTDAQLDFGEFKSFIENNWKSNCEQELIEAFRFLDSNGNGFIEAQELKKVLMQYGDDKLTEKEVNQMVSEMIGEADVDLNRKIDYYEFSRVLSTTSDWQSLERKSVHSPNKKATPARRRNGAITNFK